MEEAESAVSGRGVEGFEERGFMFADAEEAFTT